MRTEARAPASHLEKPEGSRPSSRQHFEATFEPVGFKSLAPFCVVVGIVGVEPIALGVHAKVRDLG